MHSGSLWDMVIETPGANNVANHFNDFTTMKKHIGNGEMVYFKRYHFGHKGSKTKQRDHLESHNNDNVREDTA